MLFRSLPGVQSINETSNGLYIRGGTPDQNQILLDDTEVYNPSHLGGIFSTFNSDAIASVDLYKAGFPSRYGDRLSSVLDIHNKDGNRKESEGIFRLSMMSGSGTIQGPWAIGGEKGSYMASFRRTLYELLDFDIPESHFYDGHVKLNWDAGLKDKIFFSSYFGEDYLHMEEGEDLNMNWGNNTFTGQWQHVFNSQLYGKLNISNSRFHFDLDQVFDGEASVTQENRLNDITLKANFHYQSDNRHQLEYGTELKYLDITFGADTNLDINTSHYPWLEVPSTQASFYCQDSWAITPRWTIQPGLRYTWCRVESEYLAKGGIEDYQRLSPRLALRYRLAEGTDISVSYGRYYQYLTATNRADWPMSLWMPIDKSVEPGEADHFVGGLQMHLGRNITLEIEGYYKELRNQVAISEEAFLEWNEGDDLSEAYNIGDGYSYGGEVLIGSNWQGMEGFLSYTYSRTLLQIDGLNLNPVTGESEYYHPRHDRTHSVNLIENYYFSRQTDQQIIGADLTMGLVYTYGTGQPAQAPEGVYEDMYGMQFINGYLDNERLPDYSRLDLSIKLKWNLGNCSIEPYVMLVNALDHENVWTRDWFPTIDNNEILLDHRDSYMFERMPFLGVNVAW